MGRTGPAGRCGTTASAALMPTSGGGCSAETTVRCQLDPASTASPIAGADSVRVSAGRPVGRRHCANMRRRQAGRSKALRYAAMQSEQWCSRLSGVAAAENGHDVYDHTLVPPAHTAPPKRPRRT